MTPSRKPLPEKEKEALFLILSDDDPSLFEALARKLAEIPESEFREISLRFDPEAKNFPSSLAEATRLRVLTAFAQNAAEEDPDLERGLLLLSAWGHPSHARRAPGALLDRFASEVIALAGGGRTLPQALVHHLFAIEKFRGDDSCFDDPDGHYLATALERRRGVPIVLASIVLLVARRAGVEVHAIGSPGHFLLGLEIDGAFRYLDAFGGGRLLDRDAAFALLPEYARRINPFPVVETREILARTIRNLFRVYFERDAPDRIRDLEEMLRMLG